MEIIIGNGHRGLLGAGNVLFFHLGVVYTGVFTL